MAIPPKCKICGDELIIGINWRESQKKIYHYKCKKCRNKESLEWNHKNNEKFRLNRRKRYKLKAEKERENQRLYRINNSLQSVYTSYKCRAKKRNLEFKLSIEEFKSYWNKKCFYCNREIKKIGLDRIDNSKGYIKENIIPCCELCNWMKRDLTFKDFIYHIRDIFSNILEKGLK